MTEQITLAELLDANPIFDKWMDKVPSTNGTDIVRPWRLVILIEGNWYKKEVKTYEKGLKILRRHLHEWDDGALQSKVIPFAPPVVRRDGKRERFMPGVPGQTPGHAWCAYCRRPTLMALFSRHHIVKRCVAWEPRCTICGHRKENLPKW